MKEFNITNTSVKIDVAAVEWPANATAIVSERVDATNMTLVCQTTDGEIRIGFEWNQMIGTSS